MAACLLLVGLVAVPAAAVEPPPVRARVLQPLATYFTDFDYPEESVRKYEQGPVAFRLAVGADGKPTGCTVTGSSGSSLLDSTTCRIVVERPRFEPARDSGGKAVPDEVTGRIVWRLPEDAPWTRLDGALQLWTYCVTGEAAKLALASLAVDEAVRRSFPPCAALEVVLPKEGLQPEALAAARTQISQAAESIVVEARRAFLPPAGTGVRKEP